MVDFHKPTNSFTRQASTKEKMGWKVFHRQKNHTFSLNNITKKIFNAFTVVTGKKEADY